MTMKIILPPPPPDDDAGHSNHGRMPRPGEREPRYGLSRSWLYSAERRGLLKLKRIRNRGCQRGLVLIPYDQIRRLLDDQNNEPK